MEKQIAWKILRWYLLVFVCLVAGAIVAVGMFGDPLSQGNTVQAVPPATPTIVETFPARSVYVPRDVTVIGDNNDVVVGNDPVEEDRDSESE